MNLIIKGLISYVFVLIFMLLTQLVFYTLSPVSYWFEYQSITPTQQVFTSNEPIRFISLSDIKKPGKMIWNDILYCKYDNETTYSSIYISAKVYTEPSYNVDKEVKSWQYNGTPISRPTKCFLEANTCMEIQYGIKKCAITKTESFLLE